MSKKTLVSSFIVIALVFLSACVQNAQNSNEPMPLANQKDLDEKPEADSMDEQDYNPAINPADFTSVVDNKYFNLVPGKKMVYEGKTEDGTERIEVFVTGEKKTVMGVETAIVWDRVWLNGELIEDTFDWYAQDKEGNVWYFGEDTAELLGGKIINHNGAWEAGVNGAKPGIVMKASPLAGDSYRQEYFAGIAEDMADVLALGETVSVPFGILNDCIKTRDYTLLEPGIYEHKYYCPDASGVVLEIGLEDGERAELISVTYDEEPSPVDAKPEEFVAEITEEKAKEIALKEVPGKVTDVSIERKFGKETYVVEIDADNGPETDVIIDIDTGEVLGVEE